MKLKSRKISHPSGIQIRTPLLIPSFSSKGFATKNDGKSEICTPLKLSTEFLTESMLISAFDIHFNHIPEPQEFAFATEFVVIDSGGYETSSFYDFPNVLEFPIDSEKISSWDIEKLNQVIKDWPEEYPAIIVNFDHGSIRKKLKEQIDDADQFFKQYSNMLHTFLVKPETFDQDYIQIDSVIDCIKLFNKFDIIAFTEKELDSSILKRMKNIQIIREALDMANVDKPIHIFGSLDPITSILYFLAGAEIFDGLTWLRYSYHRGTAMYTSNFSVLDNSVGISTHDDRVKAQSVVNNLQFLNNLKIKMINFISTQSFNEFESLGFPGFSGILENSYSTFINY